jgi:hypothetical protein
MNEEKTLMDFVKQAKAQIQEIDVSAGNVLLEEGYQVLGCTRSSRIFVRDY